MQPELQTPSWAERLVRLLDDGLTVPGTKFRVGLDGIAGLIVPGAGDALGAAGALSIFWLALQRGAPRVVLLRMAINVAIDALVGAVPLLGDLFDFVWKANRRNLRLLERTAVAPRQRTLGDYAVVALFFVLLLCAIGLPFVVAGVLLAKFAE